MKNSFLLTLLIVFFAITTIISQDECGTVIPTSVTFQQAQSGDLSLYKRTALTDPLRIAIHIVRTSSGTGGISQTVIEEKVLALNNCFQQAFFLFEVKSIDYIDSDQLFWINSENECNELLQTNNKPGYINIYFVISITVNNIGLNGLSTFSPRINSSEIQGILVRNDAPQTTLPHEMGHFFDLFHIYETYFGNENIARTGSCSNWSYTGDLLGDTPADPSGRVIFATIDHLTCSWITPPIKPLPLDGCNQNNYQPLANNMMHTQVAQCRTSFTGDQIDRMNETLQEYRSELLLNVVYLENRIGIHNALGTINVGVNTYQSGSYAFLNEGIYTFKTNNERFINFQNSGFNYKHNNWNLISSKHFLQNIDNIEDYYYEEIANFHQLKYAKTRALLEGIEILGKGEYEFLDPWYVKSDGTQSGNFWIPCVSSYEPDGKHGATEKGVFLNQGADWQPPYYSVKAISPQDIQLQQTGKTHRFYFQNWGGENVEYQYPNQLETGVVFTNENAIVSANYKGTQLSSNANAYYKGNQRKFLRVTGSSGKLYSVYESMGNIYLERSTNNGSSWEIFNNNLGDKLNVLPSHSPSMDFYQINSSVGDLVLVTFVEEMNEEVARIELVILSDKLGNPNLRKETVVEIEKSYVSSYGNPVIAAAGGGKFIIIFKGMDSERKGLYYRRGTTTYNSGTFSYSWQDDYYEPPQISGTNNNSKNPSIAEDKNTSGISYQLAWEERSNIYFSKLNEANGVITQVPYSIISGGSFEHHYSPSVIAIGNSARVTWQGLIDMGEVITSVVFRDPDYDRFWSFGNNVSLPNINKTNNNSYYAFGWSQNGSSIKFADNSLSSIYNIGIPGKDVQISNGTSATNMYANIFKVASQPYFFSSSNKLSSYFNYMDKENSITISRGRTGIVGKNEGEIYYALGDVVVAGEAIKFKECPIDLQITGPESINEYLETEAFNINNNSTFEYSVQFGAVDTVKAQNIFNDGGSIRFKLALIDNNSQAVIGIYDDIVFDAITLAKYDNIQYQVNTSGVGPSEVKLKLTIEENINAKLTMLDRLNDEGALGKGKLKLINFNGQEVPTEYMLYQNYPNPFNPTTTITYQIPKDGLVTLKVYDILGREITTLVNEVKTAGKYSVVFNSVETRRASTSSATSGVSLPSGVYLYELKAGEYKNVKKFVLVK